MELVWYRMLGPLLGGTVFTFGIILAVALLGIGLGGTAVRRSSGRKSRPRSTRSRVTCLLEAILVAVPYALGDRVATLALLLRPLGVMSFRRAVAGWTLVTLVVVLPASIVAGVQFPMLIALHGPRDERGRRADRLGLRGEHGGSIAGALAGGFGLLPALSVLGAGSSRRACSPLVGLGAAVRTLEALGRRTLPRDVDGARRSRGLSARRSRGTDAGLAPQPHRRRPRIPASVTRLDQQLSRLAAQRAARA